MSRTKGCANFAICLAGQGQAAARESLPPGRHLATGAEAPLQIQKMKVGLAAICLALSAVAADKLAVTHCIPAAGLHPSDRLGSESEPEISS